MICGAGGDGGMPAGASVYVKNGTPHGVAPAHDPIAAHDPATHVMLATRELTAFPTTALLMMLKFR